MFFLTFLNIYDVDITFRSIKGSMAVFDFNSTSKKHKQHATRTLEVRYSSCCMTNLEPIVFSLYSKPFWTVKKREQKNECYLLNT